MTRFSPLLDEEVHIFIINSFSFDLLSEESKNKLMALMGSPLGQVREFCDLYFDKFYLMHKMGHIVLELFDPEHSQYPARTEYLANLFALKYYEKKSEHEYVENLKQVVESYLTAHVAHFDFEIQDMNPLFHRYKLDLLTYTVFHFNSFRKCLNDKRTFEEVLLEISRNNLCEVSNFTLLRKGMEGQRLVNECTQTIFELNMDVPSIEVRFGGDILVESLDVQHETAPLP